MVLAVLILSGMVAAPVFAGPGYRYNCPYGEGAYEYGPGASGSNLTSEQIEQLEKLAKTYIDETSELRNTLWEKRSELDAIMVTSAPDATKAMALQKEISDIKASLSQKRLEYQLNVKKVAPDVGFVPTPGFGWGRRAYDMMGPGYGMRGPGYGHMMGPGYSRMHRGYGPIRRPQEDLTNTWEWKQRYGRHMMDWDRGYGYGPCWY
jgi:zinc resistance-associated protein